ncbi:MAG: Gfo/Idh/MocA family oxidoreductase, partial [Rhodoglobus sp.]|nr:Gfo/Idh/MocA family oxidoreductase [Rhodoglobus sp.]
MSKTGPVGVGVIGAGNISTQYLDNLTTFPDLDVVFVADLDVERAREQADKYGIVGSGSVTELLEHPQVEIVVNLTIPAAHVEVALTALTAGKNVWTEKPIGLDRASARTVVDSAARLGLRAATAPDTILGPGLQAGRRLISEGRIGTVLTALAIMQGSGPEAWHPNPDFLYAKGAGPLFDMGPYYLTALVQNLGPVRRVAALSSTSHTTRTIGSGPRAGEDFAVEVPTHFGALLEFESSASAQCIFSFQSGVRRSGLLEISGTLGTVALPDPNGFDGDVSVFAVELAEPDVLATTSSFGRGAGVVDLARSIRAGVPEQASAEQAFHVLDIMVAITEAAESGDYADVVSTTNVLPALPVEWNPRE